MTKPNLGLADLNLLRVFLAIWDLRSLTAAGERLELTQPAVSHALRRLRTLFDDPLFVRTPTGMVPTDAAHRLYPPLAQALSIINEAVQQLAKFDPSTARRVFRISMSDMSEFFFLPPLLALLDREARGIRIEVVNVPVEAVSAAMRAGEIDLALGYVPGLV
jgi:DNA-binding transcriptional LysR family regulator